MTSSNPLAQIWRELDGIKRFLAEVRSSMGVFENATVGAGGIDLKKGGGLRFYDEADVLAMQLAAGTLEILNNGRFSMRDGTGDRVLDAYQGLLDLIDPDSGNKLRLYRGRISFYDGSSPGTPGRISVDQGAGANILRVFPPYSTGTGLENSITVRGRSPGQSGFVWVYSDGGFLLDVDQNIYIGSDSGQVYVGAPDVFLDGNQVNINTGGNLRLYELPTTGAAANLRLLESGDPRVAWVTSSRRYKQDVEDVTVDVADVLAMRPKSWRDKGEVDKNPETTARYVGFIAEDLDKLPTLRRFVDYDVQGRPDAIQYDRLTVALHAAVVAGHERIVTTEQSVTTLKATVDAQAKTITDQAAKIAALEKRLSEKDAADAKRDQQMVTLTANLSAVQKLLKLS